MIDNVTAEEFRKLVSNLIDVGYSEKPFQELLNSPDLTRRQVFSVCDRMFDRIKTLAPMLYSQLERQLDTSL